MSISDRFEEVGEKIKGNREKLGKYIGLGFLGLFLLVTVVFVIYGIVGMPSRDIVEQVEELNPHVRFDFGEQFEEALLLDMQEINIEYMKREGLSGADVVLKIMEQYIDRSYGNAYVSENYILPRRRDFRAVQDRDIFVAVLVGYENLNNLLYCQVFYNLQFFFVIISKEERDVSDNFEQEDLQHFNYDKYNVYRRENVKNYIQKNNIEKMGIEKG